MRLFCVILERSLPQANGNGCHLNPLRIPFGAGTLLDHLLDTSAQLACQRVVVVGRRHRDETWQNSNLTGPPLAHASTLAEAIASLEPSDTVLLVDPRNWPGRHDEIHAIVRDADGWFGATHARPLGNGQDRVIERVERDERERVCRIRRLYEPKTWICGNSPVAYSLVPALLLHGLECASLSDLRLALVRRGVPTRDRTIQGAIVDLADERSRLRLAETSVEEAAALESLPENYSRLSPGVLVGRGALVHGSARIGGPVVIQPGSLIEADVSIVGPALIGARSVVRRGALIARSLVMQGSDVSAGATACNRVVPAVGSYSGPGCEGAGGSGDEDDWSYDETSPLIHRDDPADGLADRTPSRRLFFAWKRATDALLAALGLIVLSPLLVVVAILIKLDSRGPVFFIHRREGRGGREFPCYKFRSMRQDAHTLQGQLYAKNLVDGPQFKLRSDPRVTRVGRFLRRTNIDELPQLINVLLGHVSLVGPRPSPFRENQICVPWRRARLSVRPGITGLWQLCRSPERSHGDFQEWIHYDMAYVRHMSAWVDFKILMATILTFGGHYRVPLNWFIGSRTSHSQVSGAPQRPRQPSPVNIA